RPQAGALTYHLHMTERRYRAGESIEDICRACKMDRMHTVIVVDGDGRPIRVSFGYCDSEHNYRGGPAVVDRPSSSTPPKPAVARAGQTASYGGAGRTAKADKTPFPLVGERERVAP